MKGLGAGDRTRELEKSGKHSESPTLQRKSLPSSALASLLTSLGRASQKKGQEGVGEKGAGARRTGKKLQVW